MRVLALDFETSGTDPQRHAPVTLGVAACELGEEFTVEASMHWQIRPATHWKTGEVTREYTENAALIHGNSMQSLLEEGTPMPDVLHELGSFIRDNGLIGKPAVAYNMPFDVSFLSTLCFLAGEYDFRLKKFMPARNPVKGVWYDVIPLAKDQLILEDYKLTTVAKHLGLEGQSAVHDACEDAILAARVLHQLRTPKQAICKEALA